MELSLAARILAVFGLVLLLLAGLLHLLDRLDIPLGNLPGDIQIKWGSLTCAIPIISSLLISVVVTVIINLVYYFLNK